jgi:hypothetical protein
VTSSKLFDSPTVPPLHKLIDDVIEGGILVPEFQREFVWTADQRLDLLDSVLRGMPIGSLFVWKTRLTGVRAQSRLGPRAIAAVGDDGKLAIPRTFLLDGLQRMTTLVGALAPREGATADRDAERWSIYYDLAPPPRTSTRDRLSVRQRIKDGVPDPTQLPLHLTLDDFAMSDFQAALRDFEETERRAMIRESQRIASTLKGYPVPIVPIVSDDIDLVTESFQRVNSTGTRMSEEHMANALTFASGINLPARIEGIAGALQEFGWGTIEPRVLLSALKAMFDIELSKPRPAALQKMLVALKKDGEDPFLALEPHGRSAAEFLSKRCHIRGPEVLPYAYQFVALCEAAARHNFTDATVRALYQRWFWATTFSEHFASMNSTQLGRAIEFARSFGAASLDDAAKLLKGEVGSDPIQRVTRYNFNGARTRALSVILGCAAESCSPQDRALDLLGAEGNGAMQNLSRRQALSTPGNRVLLRAVDLPALRELLRQPMDGAVVHAAAQHLIPLDAISAWRAGDDAAFVALRGDHLWEREKAFVQDMAPDVFIFEN